MASTATRRVYWPAKFGDRVVSIDAEAFDPKVHRDEADGPAPAKTPATAEATPKPKAAKTAKRAKRARTTKAGD